MTHDVSLVSTIDGAFSFVSLLSIKQF